MTTLWWSSRSLFIEIKYSGVFTGLHWLRCDYDKTCVHRSGDSGRNEYLQLCTRIMTGSSNVMDASRGTLLSGCLVNDVEVDTLGGIRLNSATFLVTAIARTGPSLLWTPCSTVPRGIWV